MLESAVLKIDRAGKHIADLDNLFREHRPFTYVVETNTRIGQRATRAKKNEAIIKAAAILCGDAIHNLRTALDHAYYARVLPFARSPREERAVQFPFSETATRLDEAIKNRLADRVSNNFFNEIKKLKPHGELGGNENLYLIHELDVVDKHRLLIPTGDYRRVTSEMIRAQISDFPNICLVLTGGMNNFDMVWKIAPASAGWSGPDHLEQELDIPVEIIFEVGFPDAVRPIIPTLHALTDVTREVTRIVAEA